LRSAAAPTVRRPPPEASGLPPLIAVDVETAHKDWGHVCQLGAAWRRADGGIETFERLVQPPRTAEWMFEKIHGVSRGMCEGAPPLHEAWSELLPVLKGRTRTRKLCTSTTGHSADNEGASAGSSR